MYYFINQNELLGYSDDKQDLFCYPQEEVKEIENISAEIYNEFKECFKIKKNTLIFDENLYNRKKLDKLILTPSDVERALYYSDLQMDFDDLKAFIAEKAPQIDLKGLAIEFRANNFYRGAEDKDGNRIIDFVGTLLGYTSEDMDYLFINKQLPQKEK